jgi:hypothetical protein
MWISFAAEGNPSSSDKLIVSVLKACSQNCAKASDWSDAGKKRRNLPARTAMKTIRLKDDMPLVHEALQRMERELALARQNKEVLLKLVHGYGSTGTGGDIRIAVQKRLLELAQNSQIRGCIFGENWSKSDEQSWKLLQSHPELKSDSDLGRRNQGITILLL